MSDEMTMNSEELAGQTALVTGASRGIGAAIAESLARRGAHVVITARTAGGLEELEDRIHDAGGSATIAPLDLTDGDSIARLASAIAAVCRPCGSRRRRHRLDGRQAPRGRREREVRFGDFLEYV